VRVALRDVVRTAQVQLHLVVDAVIRFGALFDDSRKDSNTRRYGTAAGW